jgi:hypothetical protein
MPAGDGTGPAGMGPRTGRGMGYCGGYDAPGWANWGPGRSSYGPRRGFYGVQGRGMRGGRRSGFGPGAGGRGWRHQYYATGLPRWARWGIPPTWNPPSREQEVDMLKEEADWLREQLEAITARMEELDQE